MPAHSRLIDFLPSKGYCDFMLKLMCLKLTSAPTSRLQRYCDTAPPSYRFTRSWKEPVTSFGEMGV